MQVSLAACFIPIPYRLHISIASLHLFSILRSPAECLLNLSEQLFNGFVVRITLRANHAFVIDRQIAGIVALYIRE